MYSYAIHLCFRLHKCDILYTQKTEREKICEPINQFVCMEITISIGRSVCEIVTDKPCSFIIRGSFLCVCVVCLPNQISIKSSGVAFLWPVFFFYVAVGLCVPVHRYNAGRSRNTFAAMGQSSLSRRIRTKQEGKKWIYE